MRTSVSTVVPTPTPPPWNRRQSEGSGRRRNDGKGPLQTSTQESNEFDEFNHSLRSPSWSGSSIGVMQTLRFTPSNQRNDRKVKNPMSSSPGYYTYSSDVLPNTPTPHSSDYTVNENDYLTPKDAPNGMPYHLAPKFANSFFSETWILMRRNFKNIRRTPELFLSRLVS
ncbi:hypothetical protein GH714_033800 [Hevea brasiliensis]|uniref:Uncharacterized protein n=1 Tax=Hevea brasiliensis TaxID=3981 RepID=A0A6A6L5L1_HEVBR|nr:hypothetical protein GH714_033800 [Hevea brasiliensis]